MAKFNEIKKTNKVKKPDFSGIISCNPIGFVARQNIGKATGDVISPKYAACLDSDPDAEGIKGRFKIGRKVCYPVHEVVAFLERRTIIARKLKDIPDIPSREWMYPVIYLAVKAPPIIWGKEINRGFSDRPLPSEERLQEMWFLIDYAGSLISSLTPREMTKIFPITKDYDGHKFECKDYFTTIQMIEDIGLDIPIADNMDTFLFDYRNRHITYFNVFKMCLCSDLRRYQGQPGIMEEFMEDQGITPMKMMTDDDGKKFLYDPAKLTTYPVIKRRPRYLKVVPGQGQK